MDLKFRPSFFFSFLIFIFLLSKPDLGSASNPKCISTERQALLTFKQSLTDPSGRLSSWSGPDCCNWHGVGCHRRTSRVIKIDLRNPNQLVHFDESKRSSLGGKINPSLTRLKFLSYLDLSSNNFNGLEIPEFIGHIVSLRYLNLSFSSFSGEVPAVLGNLSKLESLDLNTGPEPSLYHPWFYLRASNLGWLSGLSSSLTYLDMGHVGMSSETWLQDFSRLSKLKELHLHKCGLGNLPLSLSSSANLKLLEVLDLSENSFISPIPNWLFDLTSLKKLLLKQCELEGLIPSGFKKLQLLDTLDMTHNLLSGELPAVLGDLPRLKYLDLSGNSFQGQIHRFLDALSKKKGNSSLLSLRLYSNRLEGTLPESLGALRNLETLDLSSNSFTGSIPSSVGKMASLKKLVLSYNSIKGEIPSSLCQLTELETLNLGNNRFSGSFPNCWHGSSKLYEIDASENSISGGVPESLCKMPSLNVLLLNQNALQGNIPDTFQNCSSLRHIDLGGNKLTGKLPSWLSKVFPLSILRLQSNSFDGQIPDDLCSARSLYILDLSENKLSGPIPKCIGNLTAIVQHKSSSADTYQEIHDSINLSGNNINGEIPAEILDLTYLRILNLSRNSIAGSIPGKISKLGHLETLDLSRNRFSGAIPQSLAAISSLHTLNLSYNKLEGSIPKQLKFEDPSIYVGNELLCGKPLPKKCPRKQQTVVVNRA